MISSYFVIYATTSLRTRSTKYYPLKLKLTTEPQPLSNVNPRKAVETISIHFRAKYSQFFIPACLTEQI